MQDRNDGKTEESNFKKNVRTAVMPGRIDDRGVEKIYKDNVSNGKGVREIFGDNGRNGNKADKTEAAGVAGDPEAEAAGNQSVFENRFFVFKHNSFRSYNIQ